MAIRSLREAMTRDDLPLLLQDSMNKILIPAYKGVASTWQQWTYPGDVQNFLTQHRISLSEMADLPLVAEREEYKFTKISDAEDTYRVYKRGEKFGVSWETLINDDLQGIKDIPQRMGRAAGRTIAKFAVGLLEGTTASSTVTTALADATLQTAINELEERTDADGNKIGAKAWGLIVPPAQQFTARKLLESSAVVTGENATIGDKNVLEGIVKLFVEPFLTDANDWYLVTEPNDIRGIEIGFLRGRKEPEIGRSKSDWEPLASPYDFPECDFDTDAIEYRVRFVYGGARIDTNGLLKVSVT